MPLKWDADADRKLFHCVMAHKNLTFGNEDHAAIAKMMGDDVSPGAVRNRLSGLKTRLAKEGVASAGTRAGKDDESASSNRHQTANAAATKNNTSSKGKTRDKNENNEAGDHTVAEQTMDYAKAATKKRKAASDASVHEGTTKWHKIKREAGDEFDPVAEMHEGNTKELETELRLANIARVEHDLGLGDPFDYA